LGRILIAPRVRSTHTGESVQVTLLIHSGESKTFLPGHQLRV
jgi:hypothetical protein